MKKQLLIAVMLLSAIPTFASNLPKNLPHLKVKQEKILKKNTENLSNAKVVVPLYAQTSESRSVAGSEIIPVSDPLFAMKTQQYYGD